MALRASQITTAQWIGRTLLIWLIELVTVVIVAAAIGGVQLAGLWSAVQFTAFVGILNALLWPVLARLTLPFLVFSFGFFTFGHALDCQF